MEQNLPYVFVVIANPCGFHIAETKNKEPVPPSKTTEDC